MFNETYVEDKDNTLQIVPYQKEWQHKDADDRRTDANRSFAVDHETIRKLEQDIKTALQEISKLNEDVIRINANFIKLQKECAAQHDHKTTISWTMMIAIIWVIAKSATKKTQQHWASNDNKIEWQCVHQLLSRNHADIRMADLRRIINKYPKKIGHIKTTGRGRTKIKVICDLRSFQNANVV